jgi:predicted metal-dependent HD superfamily phosphohydrolase
VYDELVRRHREPHRRYHTLVHVAHVLREARRLVAHATGADARTVALAAWFHDAVYDPRAVAGHNEDASAELATDRLHLLGLPPATVAEVGRLVRLTAGHQPAPDLAVLAADAAAYDAYVHGVRTEYAHVDDADWRTGRAAVLDHFLGLAHLFHVPLGPGDDRDARARANLAAELAALRRPAPGSVVP